MSVFLPGSRELGVIRALATEQTDRTIPESIFRKNFAPFFFGKITDKNQYEGLLKDWLAISGSPTNEVLVVDDADRVLFAVPPAMDTSGVVQKDREKGDVPLTTVVGAHADTVRRSSIAGDNFMKRASDVYVPGLISDRSEITNAYSARWSSIRSRYYPAPDVKTEQSKQSTGSGFAGDDIELDLPE